MQSDARAWVEQVLGKCLISCTAISGGKNNRAWQVDTKENRYFVKQYFNDEDNRFQRETQFLSLLSEHKVTAVPRILGSNKHGAIAIYSWLDGTMAFESDLERVVEAATFIRQINSPNVVADGANLTAARGALRSLDEFLDDIKMRVSAFDNFEIEHQVDQHFVEIMDEKIKPLAAEFEAYYSAHACLQTPFTLCLSPSDFGFHNALLGQTLSFIDFEYAGWDSAEKLITDFFAQPRHTLPARWMPQFVTEAFGQTNAEELMQRTRLLLPLTHLKWVLIFLNDFKSVEGQRREFAMADYQKTNYKQAQLEKAIKRLSLINQIKQDFL